MPYQKNQLVCISTGASVAGKGEPVNFFSYTSNDNATAVQANGYFDGALDDGLKPGDHIFASLNMGGTPSGRHYIVTVGGADVTIVDLNA